ncbi:hypothetical protein KTJ32_15415 [Acinetobacter gyllenbergii]|uniref:Uncharacterized protein n=1 Tax=Acinetobacter gyllenbergii CIP 110306 = MTCC 11365 TaxID=1217657 RepID=A0A829HE68_9GAMM|nr:hypothetical protein [Acinetobacter gyllenbergii]EPF76003.1 hypothetical protein F957_02848 [Acinetobacter gyllenbergii CIP 110306 = MTCC 11365]ESK36536.1 hypothetical protein F987_03815 [Acinetobacter gyllenbergii NIPH 230]MCU4582383.1 hypothetical protein [Acinetobacter gyllenbergii]
MNSQSTTSETQTTIPFGYALRMFLGWSILYMGSLVGFIELIRRNII